MNITKPDVLFVLSKHSGKWIKSRKIAKELGLNTTAGINRISNILYRLRKLPYIERRNNSRDYQYRYSEEIKVHPTNILPLKSASDKKGMGDNDFLGYNFIELLAESIEAYCEECKEFKQVLFCAEKNGCRVCLCKKHGSQINKQLCGYYGGVFT